MLCNSLITHRAAPPSTGLECLQHSPSLSFSGLVLTTESDEVMQDSSVLSGISIS